VSRLCSLREALSDDRLLGGLIDGDSWLHWRAVLLATQGEPLTATERAAFTEVTGRPHEPAAPVEEAWLIAGRRSGKSRAASILAAYSAAFRNHSAVLVRGETGILAVLSATTRQAEVVFNYLLAVFTEKPLLKRMLSKEPTADTISIKTEDGASIDIEVRPASFRSIRGLTLVGLVADEVAFWPNDLSSNADTEILNGARPGLATTTAQLLSLTSPYSRRGEAWNNFKKHHGPQGDPAILVANGPSRLFNSTLPQAVVDRAYGRDAAAASAEFGGEFRSDLESFVGREIIDAAVVLGRHELPPVSSVRYVAFTDPSGGSADSMTLAIAHADRDGRAILDAVRVRKPPFSPESVVEDFAAVLKTYGVHKVTGDRYAGEWPRERFREHGIAYDLSDRPKSDIYRDTLPILNSGKVELLDLPRLTAELCGLERRTARGGKDSIDHAPGAHDDIANSVCGALLMAGGGKVPFIVTPAMLQRFSRPRQPGAVFGDRPAFSVQRIRH